MSGRGGRAGWKRAGCANPGRSRQLEDFQQHDAAAIIAAIVIYIIAS